MGRSRYKITEQVARPYFLTCTVLNWITIFNRPPIVSMILDSLKFMIDNNRLSIHAFIIMEHHLHLLASSDKLSKEIGNFKSYTARTIIDYLEAEHENSILFQLEFLKKHHKKSQRYQLWQEDNHPQVIINRKMLDQKINYIHFNPVRCGYVADPEHWCNSSYHNYVGKEGLLEVEIIGL